MHSEPINNPLSKIFLAMTSLPALVLGMEDRSKQKQTRHCSGCSCPNHSTAHPRVQSPKAGVTRWVFCPAFLHNDHYGHKAAELHLVDSKSGAVLDRLLVKTTRIVGSATQRMSSVSFAQGRATLVSHTTNGMYSSGACVFLKHDDAEDKDSLFYVDMDSKLVAGTPKLVYRAWYRDQKGLCKQRRMRGEELSLALWRPTESRPDQLFTRQEHAVPEPNDIRIRKEGSAHKAMSLTIVEDTKAATTMTDTGDDNAPVAAAATTATPAADVDGDVDMLDSAAGRTAATDPFAVLVSVASSSLYATV
jgi:hypothetical protein